MIDLDQPAVNVADDVMDLDYITNRGGTDLVLQFASDKVATVASSTATPNDCAQAIQLSPSGQDIKPSQDLVICVLTNGVGAPDDPGRAKMVRLTVTGVGRDKSVDLAATAWEVPH